jgi:hypothetical protein
VHGLSRRRGGAATSALVSSPLRKAERQSNDRALHASATEDPRSEFLQFYIRDWLI